MITDCAFLLIEDCDIDQLVTRELLKRVLGVTELSIASNGAEGLAWLRNRSDDFGKQLVILLDIQMPIMSGFEFLDEYDALPEDLKRETRIFVLSSTLDGKDIERAKGNKHVHSFWSKPLSVERLQSLVDV